MNPFTVSNYILFNGLILFNYPVSGLENSLFHLLTESEEHIYFLN